MFKEIYVANYKPFKELRLPLSRVNLLIGPNYSGKTSVLEAIMLMKRLFVFGESPSVRVLKNVAPAEFFGDDKIELDKVVHKKDFSKELRFGCTVELGDKGSNQNSGVLFGERYLRGENWEKNPSS